MKLSSLQTANSKFVLGQFDAVAAMAEALGLDLSHEQDREVLGRFKSLLAKYLSNKVSGIIIDPFYGFKNIDQKHKNVGLILNLEDLDYLNKNEMPKLLENWGVENIRNNYGVAKFELYYHPTEEKALEKKQIVAELYDFCQYEKIDFLLQLRIFNPNGGILPEAEHPELQLEALQEFRKNCDLLALEYPGNALACATVTAQSDVPWILLSHREPKLEPYLKLKERLREVLESGGMGISAGSALWEGLDLTRTESLDVNWEQVEEFIKTETLDKIAELNRIVAES
ncbi:MAG: hypothetical protein ABFQ62_02010 [Patescibacteria group bacterium]